MSEVFSETQILTAAQAGNRAINNSNLYINIAGQGTGTLTGTNVDPKLVKADRLLSYKEIMSRAVNPAAENSLFSAGAINSSSIFIEILRTPAAIFVQNSFYQANNITPITIYRVDIIKGKYTITEEIEYQNCIIESVKTSAISEENERLDTLEILFRASQKQDTLIAFDQTGNPLGQNVSLINFTQGTLQAAAPAGGAAGGAAGGGAAGGAAGGDTAGGASGGGAAGGASGGDASGGGAAGGGASGGAAGGGSW